jgi:hypothetical protein
VLLLHDPAELTVQRDPRAAVDQAVQAELPPNVTATVRIASDQPAEVRDAAGNPFSAIASFPGASNAQGAVFEVASGTHEFSGPALTHAEED